jgi:hypothetical protein
MNDIIYISGTAPGGNALRTRIDRNSCVIRYTRFQLAALCMPASAAAWPFAKYSRGHSSTGGRALPSPPNVPSMILGTARGLEL